MKPWLTIGLSLLLAPQAWAQGQIVVGNRYPLVGFYAPVFDVDCRTLEGPTFSAQGYWGLSPDSLSPVGEVVSFRTDDHAGYILARVVAVSTPPGMTGYF